MCLHFLYRIRDLSNYKLSFMNLKRMSLSSLNNDPCTYKTNLHQSVGIGNYYTGQPRQDCQNCFPEDSQFIIGSKNIGPIEHGISGSTCTDPGLMDMSNELLGLTRPSTNCPKGHYQKKPANKTDCKLQNRNSCQMVRTEDTRLSNPPCTLRGTGWNRWEWLCNNPQDNVTMPFDYNISNRIVVKDNHRPVIPKPINQAPILPPLNNSDEMYKSSWMNVKSRPTGEPFMPSTYWKHCDSIGY
jgi:hypothetical protein